MDTPRWSKEQLYFDGDTYFDDLLSTVARAKRSVFMETYIFEADPLGRKVEAALIAAARRGVYVRLLVDGIGASKWIERRNPDLERSGVVLRIYHPVLFGKIISRPWTLSKLNRRDHRKVCVIDHEEAFVGSLNVSANHCRSIVGQNAWRDTGLRVEGEAIHELLLAFDHAWLRSHSPDGKRRWRDTLLKFPRRARMSSPLVRLNYTGNLRRQNAKDFKARVQNATGRIWLTNAYLAPSAPWVRQITRAASRGVDVRLLVPRKSDVFFMPWVASSNYEPLLKAGVRIFEYLPRFIHAKCVLIDDWALVGTSNLNRRSAVFDFEVDLVVTQAESRRILEEQFHRDLAQAEEVIPAKSSFAFFWVSLLGRLFGFVFKRYI